MELPAFLFKFKHELRGLVLDTAMTNLNGAQRSLYLRQIEQKIDALLAQMHEAAQPKQSTEY